MLIWRNGDPVTCDMLCLTLRYTSVCGIQPLSPTLLKRELKANTTDAATEKHVPVASVKDREIDVKVGSVPHPMTEEHLIEWIAVETKQGVKVKYLEPGDRPEEVFCNNGDAVAVYAYCNLHGLWKADL